MLTIILKTERLILKPITYLHLNFTHALHSLPETDAYNTLGIPENINETEAVLNNWIVGNNKPNVEKYTFLVCQKNTANPIGIVGLNKGKPKYKNAEIWFKIHKDFFGQGFATEAARALLLFGFEQLNLHRITAGCAVGNIASIKVLEKIGMQKEAHTRQLLPLKTGWSDNFGYAILATDK